MCKSRSCWLWWIYIGKWWFEITNWLENYNFNRIPKQCQNRIRKIIIEEEEREGKRKGKIKGKIK